MEIRPMIDIRDALILNLLDHEGAEGWSDSTRALIKLWEAKAQCLPMSEAPQDGTRILLHYWPKHYKGYPFTSWQRTPEPKWEEFHYVKSGLSDQPRWEAWTGDPRSSTIHSVHPDDCIGWLPLPEE